MSKSQPRTFEDVVIDFRKDNPEYKVAVSQRLNQAVFQIDVSKGEALFSRTLGSHDLADLRTEKDYCDFLEQILKTAKEQVEEQLAEEAKSAHA